MTNEELAAALDDESRVVGFKVRHEAAARLREMERAERERDEWKRLYEEESAEYAEVAGAGDTRAVQTVIGRLKRELAEAREEIERRREEFRIQNDAICKNLDTIERQSGRIKALETQVESVRGRALLDAQNAVLECGDGSCCAQKHAAAIAALLEKGGS